MVAQTLTKRYSDIDFAFTRTPGRNDIALSYDEMAVIRSVRYLLLTRNFERPFQPNLGSKMNDLLFEPIDALTASSLRNEIETTINNFEPRVKLNTITVTEQPDNNAYAVRLEFYIGNNSQPTSINLTLERTR
jgi:phage baseplate assembly protein W